MPEITPELFSRHLNAMFTRFKDADPGKVGIPAYLVHIEDTYGADYRYLLELAYPDYAKFVILSLSVLKLTRVLGE